MSKPFRRYRHVEYRDEWRLDDLATFLTERVRAYTGIPVTLHLAVEEVEEDADADRPTLVVRIARVDIPDAWRDRLGPYATFLTNLNVPPDVDLMPTDDIWFWCQTVALDCAALSPHWNSNHGWVVQVFRRLPDVELSLDFPPPSAWPDPAAVLAAYAAETGDDPAETLDRTPLDRASRVEGIAETAWRLAQQGGACLPEAGFVTFAARPFDDGTARLVIAQNTLVRSNLVWPTSGPPARWATVLSALAQDLAVGPPGATP